MYVFILDVTQATELALPLCEWLEFAKGKKKRVESDPLYPFLPDKLDKSCFLCFVMYSDQLVSWCMWGLANILKALKFLNEDAKQVHGYLHPSSIFVTQVIFHFSIHPSQDPGNWVVLT